MHKQQQLESGEKQRRQFRVFFKHGQSLEQQLVEFRPRLPSGDHHINEFSEIAGQSVALEVSTWGTKTPQQVTAKDKGEFIGTDGSKT